MASEKQQELFARLIERRTFPEGFDAETARAEFANLSQPEASRWIERALELPESGDSGKPVPF